MLRDFLLWYPCCVSCRISFRTSLLAILVEPWTKWLPIPRRCWIIRPLHTLSPTFVHSPPLPWPYTCTSLSLLMSYLTCTFEIRLLFLSHKQWVTTLLPIIALLLLLHALYATVVPRQELLICCTPLLLDRTSVFPSPPTSPKLNTSCPPAIWFHTRFLQPWAYSQSLLVLSQMFPSLFPSPPPTMPPWPTIIINSVLPMLARDMP